MSCAKIKKFLISLLLAGVFVLCGAELPRFKVGKQTYVRLKDLVAQYGYRARRGTTRMEVYDPAAKKTLMVFRKEQRHFYFNSVRIALSAPAVLNGNGSQVNYIDGLKTVKPLLDNGRLHKHLVRTIVLDPGHGGKDQGAAGGGLVEKRLNLQLTKRVELLLKDRGYRVLLTRKNDRFLSLPARAAFANANRADLFISIHTNSAASKVPHGIEVYCLSPAGTASTNSTAVSWKSLPGNRSDARNIRLGYFLQRSLLVRTKANDMGVKRARFAVLRDLRCPGVLVEMGFLSNKQEAAKLRSPDYLDKLAQGIADGIVKYCAAMK
ncbi:MAG: N-acetylmuramoyl-L-alanine amidase [Lentisphaeria bacterium]|nr:N-acetylmuramoyl-L-alanine amidase [Lentisphaeria bacterium]